MNLADLLMEANLHFLSFWHPPCLYLLGGPICRLETHIRTNNSIFGKRHNIFLEDIIFSFAELNFLHMLNCLCHLYWSIHHRMHNWAPFYLVYSKVYVYMVNCFYFHEQFKQSVSPILIYTPSHARLGLILAGLI